MTDSIECLVTHEQCAEAITSRYVALLRLYARASGLERVEAADELVGDAFVRSSTSEACFAAWRASGISLRRFLVLLLLDHARVRQNALKESARERTDCKGCGSCDCHGGGALTLDAHAYEQFEHAWSQVLLRDACESAERALVASGEGAAWSAFDESFRNKKEFAQIGAQLGVSTAIARSYARRAQSAFERELEALLQSEGVDAADMADELNWLIELAARA